MPTEKENQVRVWDLPTRLFHWLLVIGIVCSWYTVEILEDLQLHFYSGYAILTLLLFRIFWGIFGSFYSRFRRLFFAPHEIFAYIRALFSTQPKRYAGHNPLGSLAVIAMLALLTTQAVLGLFSGDDYYFGPLAGLVSEATINRLTDLHHQNFELIKIVIAIHILAIILYRVLKKERLTAAMFSGRKSADQLTEPLQAEPVQAGVSNRLLRAAVILIVCIAITYVVVTQIAEPVAPALDYY